MLKQTNEFIERAHGIACNHGFHDVELSVPHCMMLVMTEVSEMVEMDRRGRRVDAESFKRIVGDGSSCDNDFWLDCFRTYVKETVEDEMADVCIRLYDMCGMLGISFSSAELGVSMCDDFDDVRDCDFAERAFVLCGILNGIGGDFSLDTVIGSALCFVECWAMDMGVDLAWHVESKMRYNESRPLRHGKSY